MKLKKNLKMIYETMMFGGYLMFACWFLVLSVYLLPIIINEMEISSFVGFLLSLGIIFGSYVIAKQSLKYL